MTKKDGDKLRKMQSDLYDMAEQYEGGSLTHRDITKVAATIGATLRGQKFSVIGVNISEEFRKHKDSKRTVG